MKRASIFIVLTRLRLSLLALVAFASAAPAQESQPSASAPATAKKPLTLEAIYEGKDFNESSFRGIEWIDATHFRQRVEERSMRVDARTGESSPDYDDERFEAALRDAGFEEKQARNSARRPTAWNSDRSVALIAHDRKLWSYRVADGRIRAIEKSPEDRSELAISPGGKFASFIQGHDLYVVDTSSGWDRRLTHGGSETLLNGELDWVYQEEVYGRGNFRAYWWRADDRYVAFLQLDQSNVPSYTLIDQTQHNGRVETMRYPRPGDPNSQVRLGIASLGLLGGVSWADLSKYRGTDILIVSVSWAPDGKLIFSVQDREQRWLDLNECDPHGGGFRTLLRETTPAWVDPISPPHWLADGTFLWQSDRDGRRRLYHCRRDGTLIRALTDGPWDVRSLAGVDEAGGMVYLTGSRDTVLETHAYRVPLAGGAPERLTEPGYSHRVEFSRDFSLMVDTFSNITTPTKVYLRETPPRGQGGTVGRLVRVLSENPLSALADYQLGRAELMRIPARDGVMLNAMMIRPEHAAPGARLPVLCDVYAGPSSPTVRNAWGGKGALADHMLATEGILVWSIDPRSASGDGPASAWTAYKQLGVQELADIEDSLRWLIDQGWADAGRIAISGYSYGGFMTCYALTHSTMFKLGIAGGKVSDWRNYDSIYTERYMQTPASNAAGYDATSVVKAAGELHGRLLLVHGLMDDNVHFLNAAQLVDALQKAGKQFDLMVYPRDRHGIHHGGKHFRELRVNYLRERL